jgi:hypothetical protein
MGDVGKSHITLSKTWREETVWSICVFKEICKEMDLKETETGLWAG